MRTSSHETFCPLAWAVVALLAVGTTLAAQEPPQLALPDPLSVPAGTQLALVLQNSVSTKTAQPGDQLYFAIIYPVVIQDRVVIPTGSFVRGQVTQVRRAGRVKGRAQLHMRFDELTLPNGYTLTLIASLASAGTVNGEEVNREEGSVRAGSGVPDEALLVGAISGGSALIGGLPFRQHKDAAIGALVGAAAGLALILLTRGPELVLPRGQTVEIVLDRDLLVDPLMAKFEGTGESPSLPGPIPQNQRPRPIGSRLPF